MRSIFMMASRKIAYSSPKQQINSSRPLTAARSSHAPGQGQAEFAISANIDVGKSASDHLPLQADVTHVASIRIAQRTC
jgi:hypothetical protein